MTVFGEVEAADLPQNHEVVAIRKSIREESFNGSFTASFIGTVTGDPRTSDVGIRRSSLFRASQANTIRASEMTSVATPIRPSTVGLNSGHSSSAVTQNVLHSAMVSENRDRESLPNGNHIGVSSVTPES